MSLEQSELDMQIANDAHTTLPAAIDAPADDLPEVTEAECVDSSAVTEMRSDKADVASRGFINPVYTPTGKRKQIKSLGPRECLIMDIMLSDPFVHSRDIAARLGVSQAMISTIVHSDLFQAVLEERRSYIKKMQSAEIQARLTSVAGKGLAAMAQALDDEELPIRTKLEITKTALAGLGYTGGRGQEQAASQQNLTINNIAVSENTLSAARARILARAQTGGGGVLNPNEPVTIDGTVERNAG